MNIVLYGISEELHNARPCTTASPCAARSRPERKKKTGSGCNPDWRTRRSCSPSSNAWRNTTNRSRPSSPHRPRHRPKRRWGISMRYSTPRAPTSSSRSAPPPAAPSTTPSATDARIRTRAHHRNAAGTRLRPRRALKEFFVRRAPHPVFRRGEGPSAAVKTTRRHPVRRPHRPLLPAYPDETRAGAPARSIRSHPAGFAPPPDPENRPAVPTTPLLPSPAPARPDIEEEFVIQARHRTRKHRFVLLVEEIVDHPLDREVGPSQRKGLFRAKRHS